MIHFFFSILLFFTLAKLIAVEPPKDIYLPTTKFQSSYPYITGDTVREFCDYVLDPTRSFDPSHVKCGQTIFVMITHLEHFFHNYHTRIKEPYILITHHFFDESDDPVPGKFSYYLDDSKLIGWFTHNVDTVHPKLHILPIGIANAHYDFGKKIVFDYAISNYSGRSKKNILLSMNFSINTYPQERQKVFNYFISKKFCTHLKPKNLAGYLQDLSRSKFVLSPRGHGLDCFRTWEALMMKCYPIVYTSLLDPIFSDLPVVIINDWKVVTENFLNKKYNELKNKKYAWEKLYMPYWIQKIKNLSNKYRQEWLAKQK